MKYTPFLEQIAQYYYHKTQVDAQFAASWGNYCLVFPNHRSGQFFIKAYSTIFSANAGADTPPVLLPQVTTISDFITSLTHSTLATPIEQLFILFTAYRQVTKNELLPFDKFVYWGNILLSDFNDVDMYMVNYQLLFSNVANLSDISTDYIDDETKALIEKYMNYVFGTRGKQDRFWQRDNEISGGVEGEYVRLWDSLAQLYEQFNEELSKRGLTYNGKMYKQAATMLHKASNASALQFESTRFAFIGFNMLSSSEVTIFNSMKQLGIADFFWDCFLPGFDPSKSRNKGAQFISAYNKLFPMPADFDSEHAVSFPPSISVISVPNAIAQAKLAFSQLNVQAGQDLIHTAIVLPDENMLSPLLTSVPAGLDNINVTIGCSLRSSSIVSLMHIVARLHSQATKSVAPNGSYECSFFREDVKDLLSHPLIKSLYPNEAISIISKIDNENLFSIKQSELQGMNVYPLFHTMQNDASLDDALSFIDRLIRFADEIKAKFSQNSVSDVDDTIDGNEAVQLQVAFIDAFIDVLIDAHNALLEFGIPTCETTLFYLLDRLIAPHIVPFSGEPLKGLQIMGLLETRCLDFENIVVLSANEGIFPAHRTSPSFISQRLRVAFNMSTIDHQEAMWAYYFYHLIGRARHVTLFYDSNVNDSHGGEMSRFIMQLHRIYHCPIRFKVASSPVTNSKQLYFSIAQGNSLTDYFDKNSDKQLSASSINEYINCPMKFYFHHVQHLNDDNPPSDFMDASTIGTIVHDTLQQLYQPAKQGEPRPITLQELAGYKKSEVARLLKRNINRVYMHLPDAKLDEELAGEPYIIFDALRYMVNNAINLDVNFLKSHNATTLEVVECERPHNCHVSIGDVGFNFYFRPDRIDRIAGSNTLRILDYKTGKDPTKANVEDLFNAAKGTNRPHALLQLMLYCNAYEQDDDGKATMQHIGATRLRPVIYKLIDKDNSGAAIPAKEPINDYTTINAKFCQGLETWLQQMNNPNERFTQTTAKESCSYCKYCNYADFCRRNIG